MFKRFALVISIAVCGSLAAAAAAIAAGGGGLGPGQYQFSNKSASAFFGTLKGGPPDQSGFYVTVDQGLNSFRPRAGGGGPIVMNSTVVNLTIFTPTGGEGICYVLTNPADFTISRDLQSAALHTTLTLDELCPGFASPVGEAGAVPFGSSGGGLPASIRVDVTWTGLGVVASETDHGTFRCLRYTSEGTSSFRSSNANATGTLDALTGTFNTPVASVSWVDTQENVSGIPDPNCFPL